MIINNKIIAILLIHNILVTNYVLSKISKYLSIFERWYIPIKKILSIDTIPDFRLIQHANIPKNHILPKTVKRNKKMYEFNTVRRMLPAPSNRAAASVTAKRKTRLDLIIRKVGKISQVVVHFYNPPSETSASCNSSQGATHLADTKLSKDLPRILLKNRLLTGVRYAAGEDRDLSVRLFSSGLLA